MDIIIVSGLSVSGKSVVLHSLEDLGYYCIDNLPAALFSQFLNQFEPMANGHAEHAAVSIDSRNRQFLKSLPNALAHLRKIGQPARIVFLEATDETLLQRYSQTRRKHPLTDPTTPLLGGIAVERTLLAPLEQQADCRINTIHSTPHELRLMIREFAGDNLAGRLTLFFQLFSFKHGMPIDVDYIFDVRCLPNPHWQPEFRPLTGEDPVIIDFLQQNEDVEEMVQQLGGFLTHWLRMFEVENRSYLAVGIGCTDSRYRSVYIVNRLVTTFRDRGRPVQWRHRDLQRLS